MAERDDENVMRTSIPAPPKYAAETQEERVRHPNMPQPHRCNPHALEFVDGMFEWPPRVKDPVRRLIHCLLFEKPNEESAGGRE